MEHLRKYLKNNFEDFTVSDLGLIQYYFQLQKNNEIDYYDAKYFIVNIIGTTNENILKSGVYKNGEK